jgi:endonuclease/exonuclease/phosphatase family metal-dependent hydrolase
MARHPAPALAVLALAALAGLTACDPFNTGFKDTEQAVSYRASRPGPEPAPSGPLRVVTWNVKFGGARLRFFFECRGTRVLMTEAEVQGNVGALGAYLEALAPDLVLLQEVDTAGSKRSAYVDQVQLLLDASGLNYAAYASQWKADYIPSDGQGAIDSGNAVLSRWPITSATRHALPLQTDISSLERYFYLKRNLLEVHLAVPTLGEVAVVATHAEAFSKDGTKKKHLDLLKALMDELSARGLPVLGGGDLNEIPSTSPVRANFPDDANCSDARFDPDSYVGEETWLDALTAAYLPDVTPAAFGADPGPWYTFVGDEAFPLNRKLDHLFTNRAWAPGSVRVMQDALLLSDHVPLVAGWQVAP